MADGAEFPIKIRTDLEGKGFKEITAEMQATQREIKSANAELKQTASVHEEVGQQAKQSGKQQEEAAEGATLSHRELRESVRAVANQFGGLADVGLWLSPMTAALAIVLTAVEALKKVWESLQAGVEAFNESLQAIDDAKLKSTQQTASKLVTDLGEMVDKQSALQSAFNRGDAALQNSIKLYNEKKDAITKVAEAEEKAFEAELEHQVATGQISKEQADAKKAAAQLALGQLTNQNEEAKKQNEITQLGVEYGRARLRVIGGRDRNDLIAAEKAAAQPASAAAEAAAAVESAKKAPISVQGGKASENWISGDLSPATASFKDAEELRAEIQKQKEALADYTQTGRLHNWQIAADRPEDQAERKKQMQSAIAANEEALRSHETNISNLQKLSDLAEVENKHAQQKIANAQAQSEADQKLNVEGAARIQALQDELQILRETNAAVAAAHTRTAQSQAATEHAAAQEEAFGNAETLLHRLQTQGGSAQDWQRMATLMAGLMDHVTHLHDVDRQRDAAIRDLEAKFQLMQGWHNNNGNTHS